MHVDATANKDQEKKKQRDTVKGHGQRERLEGYIPTAKPRQAREKGERERERRNKERKEKEAGPELLRGGDKESTRC